MKIPIESDYEQILTNCVEVKATLSTGKLEFFKLDLHLRTRSWEFMNPLAGTLELMH